MLLSVSGLYLYNTRDRSINSLAVLPFLNLSGDANEDYFADGLTEALITDLARLKSVRVISRTSIMRFKGAKRPISEIARELGVDAVVEGSVLRSGGRVWITANLIHGRTDQHLWAQSYEREFRDVIGLHRDVSRAIGRNIKAELPGNQGLEPAAEKPISPAAYESYLKGRYFWNKRTDEGFRKAIDYFQQAIEIEPQFALAYSGLADGYNMLANYDLVSANEVIPEAKKAAARAIELDYTLAEAHASLGFAHMHYDWDWSGAEGEFKRAMELNPNYPDAHHWYGLMLAMRGRFEEAIAELERARALDPLSLIISTNLGWVYYFQGRYDDAISQCRKALAMDSTFSSAHVKLGWAFEQREMYAEAVVDFHTALQSEPDDPALLAMLGRAHALAGDRADALEIVGQLTDPRSGKYVSPYLIAVLYSALGEKEKAFEWLQKSLDQRCGWLVWMKVDPKVDDLRSDPRFVTFLNRVGLS